MSIPVVVRSAFSNLEHSLGALASRHSYRSG
jgi:hypothetical protein